MQRNMLYHPSKYLPSQAALSTYNIQYWPSNPKEYRGFISTRHAGALKGTIIVFHGNAGTAADRVYYVQALTRLGYRIILAEYPGYGTRKGELGEVSFVQDAKETLRLASEKYGSPIYLLGESLGCAVAAAAAKDPPLEPFSGAGGSLEQRDIPQSREARDVRGANIDGIILITPWDTLLSVAKEKFTWLPVSWFLRDTYDSIGNLKGYPGRIAVIGAEQDEVIPLHHAEALFSSLPGSRKMYVIKGAGHNDWLRMVDLSWWKEITGFIEGN
ncbi:MAG: hypothetical protein A2X56_13520 [Nitrospirae bacterium GWC2_57_13]|nr:MAG: hypothetical protein A2X56_13520 [Nitrospirae bacterium GWC2_57_13]